MKEIINIIESKNIMKNTNIIIYGTIRDIEKYFLTSFSNLDLISNYFNKVFIIICENDSSDETRTLLKSWYLTRKTNIIKHILLTDNLVNSIPKRAHRLAFCRNEILNYIFNNNLDKEYQYAIHIDLDDRFWGVDIDGIINCFQYDLNKWDVMTCVNKDKIYYDYWALRTNLCWFDKNIFSCESNGVLFTDKIYEFELLLEKNNGLIEVFSAFNGFGIYKLSSMKNCYYNARYNCRKCNNTKIGCSEDNDHIGLHYKMHNNGCKIFINTNLQIINTPNKAIDYESFIGKINDCPTINKNILLHLLYNNLIEKTGAWIEFGTNDGSYSNILSNYNENKIFSFTENDNDNNYIYLNKNIELIEGNIDYSSIVFKNTYLENSLISLLLINYNSFILTKKVFKNLFDKISTDTIIVFKKFINYSGYIYNQLKVFYEFTQLYNITFEWIGKNSEFNLYSSNKIQKENENIIFDIGEMVALKIIKNPYYTDKNLNYLDFNWILYKYNNLDLRILSNKEEAWLHYKNYGINENREYNISNKDKVNYNNFDWELYINTYYELKENNIKTKIKAWEHYINYGKYENKQIECVINNLKDNENVNKKKSLSLGDFDYELYLELNDDLKNNNLTKEEAYRHWVLNGSLENRLCSFYDMVDNLDENHNKIKYIDFDYEEYLELNRDLHIDKTKNIKLEAFKHYVLFGIKEKRKYKKEINLNDNYDNFDYKTYLDLNPDLKEANLLNKQDAWTHWITYGKDEGRLKSFDWILYIKKFNLDSINIHNKEKAIKHWLDNGKPSFENTKSELLLNKDLALFDWIFYKNNYPDLNILQTKEDALEHYVKYGRLENRKTNDFNWINYIFLNDDLIENGIETEEKAIIHYLNIGKKEKRKYKK